MKIEPGMVAVVTGAGSGIGRALAEKAAQAGMHVLMTPLLRSVRLERKQSVFVPTFRWKTTSSDWPMPRLANSVR